VHITQAIEDKITWTSARSRKEIKSRIKQKRNLVLNDPPEYLFNLLKKEPEIK